MEMHRVEQGIPLKNALPLLFVATYSTDLEDPLNFHQIKASFLFNMLRFIEWPLDVCAADGRLNLAICGSPSLDVFRTLQGMQVHNRTIYVHRIKTKELPTLTSNKHHI